MTDAETGDVSRQIYAALAEQQWAAAIRLAEESWPQLLSYRMHVLRAVADALPESVVRQNPRWATVRQFMGTFLMDPRLRGAWAPRSKPVATSDPFDRAFQLTESAVSAAARGDLAEAIRLAESAVALIRRDVDRGGRLRAGMMPGVQLQLGFAFEFGAQESQALELLNEAYVEALAVGDIRTAANASGELAWMHAIAGRRAASDQWIERHLLITSTHRKFGLLRTTVHLAIASRLHDELRREDALAELAKIRNDVADHHWGTVASHEAVFGAFRTVRDAWATLTDIDQAVAAHGALPTGPSLNRQIIEYARALTLVFARMPEAALPVLDAAVIDGGRDSLLSLRAATRYALGDTDGAEQDASRCIMTPHVWPRSRAESLVVRAAARLRRGDGEGAVDDFRQAVTIAVQNTILLVLTYAPFDDFTRLATLSFGEDWPEELRTLAQDPALFVPHPAPVDRLTGGESRILVELAKGSTVPQVAARLKLSGNTVKIHARAIYRKLGVHDRAAMIAEATRRGLA